MTVDSHDQPKPGSSRATLGEMGEFSLPVWVGAVDDPELMRPSIADPRSKA